MNFISFNKPNKEIIYPGPDFAGRGGRSVQSLIAARSGQRSKDFFDRRVATVSYALRLLKQANPDIYDEYMEELEKAKESVNNPTGNYFEGLGYFDSLIEAITYDAAKAERVVINNDLIELNQKYKNLLHDHSNPFVILDDFILGEGALIVAITEREKGIPFTEEEDGVPTKWDLDVYETRKKFGQLLIESMYRIESLTFLKRLHQGFDMPDPNLYGFYEGNEQLHIRLFMTDLQEIVARIDEVAVKYGEAVNEHHEYATLVGYADSMRVSPVFEQMKEELEREGSTEGSSVSAKEFSKIATKMIKMSVLVNQLERGLEAEHINDLDSQVREDADKTMQQGNYNPDRVARHLNEIAKNSNNGYYYQIAIAKSMGLISDDNLLASFPSVERSAASTLALIEYANRRGKTVRVIPSDVKDGKYLTVSDVTTMDQELECYEIPEKSMANSNHVFCYKVSVDIMREFLRRWAPHNYRPGDVRSVLSYSYDPKTGLYSLYTSKKTSGYQSEIQDEFYSDMNEAMIEERERIEADVIRDHMYPFFVFDSHEDMIPLLGELKQAGIEVLLKPDEGWKGTMIYYPIKSTNKIVELSKKYDFTPRVDLDNGYEFYEMDSIYDYYRQFLYDLQTDSEPDEKDPEMVME